MRDLKTEKGRRFEFKKIEDSFLSQLKENSFEICPDAVCNISFNSIELGIKASGSYLEKGFKMAFASDITIYCRNQHNIIRDRENEINYGSSGSFTPKEESSYWRTIHAATILKNWELAFSIANEHCKMYSTLIEKIEKENNLN